VIKRISHGLWCDMNLSNSSRLGDRKHKTRWIRALDKNHITSQTMGDPICNSISLSLAYHTYIPELIQYARACWTYDHAILKWRHAFWGPFWVQIVALFPPQKCYFFQIQIAISPIIKKIVKNNFFLSEWFIS
jgi:hypothetical protein